MNNISIPLDIENIPVVNTTINNDNSIVIEVESTEKVFAATSAVNLLISYMVLIMPFYYAICLF